MWCCWISPGHNRFHARGRRAPDERCCGLAAVDLARADELEARRSPT